MSEIIFSEWFSWVISIFILVGAGLTMVLIALDARGNSPNANSDREWPDSIPDIPMDEITSTTGFTNLFSARNPEVSTGWIDHHKDAIDEERYNSGVHETAD